MSHVIEVPGGTAEFFDEDELTVRRMRPFEELSLQVSGLINRITTAGKVTGAAEAGAMPGLVGPDVVITDLQASQMARFSDVVTFMFLKSWTVDQPFPTCADSLLDLPRPLYTAVSKHAGELLHAMKDGRGFELSDETVENTDSPTGVSDGSETL